MRVEEAVERIYSGNDFMQVVGAYLAVDETPTWWPNELGTVNATPKSAPLPGAEGTNYLKARKRAKQAQKQTRIDNPKPWYVDPEKSVV